MIIRSQRYEQRFDAQRDRRLVETLRYGDNTPDRYDHDGSRQRYEPRFTKLRRAIVDDRVHLTVVCAEQEHKASDDPEDTHLEAAAELPVHQVLQRFEKTPEHGAPDAEDDHSYIQRRFVPEKPVQSIDEADPRGDRHRKR